MSPSLQRAPSVESADRAEPSQRRRGLKVPLACSAVAIMVSGFAALAALSAADWRLSGLVRIARDDPLAEVVVREDHSFALVRSGTHYDGVFFYAIARDPLALGEEHGLIDRPGYRYGHAGYGWLAWAASGGGQPAAIPGALLGLNLLGMAVAAAGASRLAREFGWSEWGGLVVAFNPGLISAVTFDTGEPVGVAIMVLALLAWKRERLGLAAIGLVALCLMKEPYVLVPLGLLAWEGVRWLRGDRARDLGRRIVVLGAGPAAFAVWYGYLRLQFGHWPFTEATDVVSGPIVGWIASLSDAARLGRGPFLDFQLGNSALPLIAVAAGLLLVALIRALRFRTWLDTIFYFYFILGSMLNPLGLLVPKDMVRELAVLFLLVPAVLATPHRPAPNRPS